jgi:hypothetical protein
VQRARPDDEKPDRTSLPKGVTPEHVDFDFALKLLTLPREVGLHPETGKPITAGLGRYGPFVQHEGKFANLDNFEEIFTVGLNRAVDVLASKQARGGRAGPAALRDLGPHPEGGGNLQVMSGRYGPYIKYDKVNATLPRDVTPESVTLDQAVALVAEKQSKGGPRARPRQRRRRRRRRRNGEGGRGEGEGSRQSGVESEAESEISSEVMSLRNPGKAKPAEQQLPSEAEVLDYVRSRPGKVNKRDVARAFGIRSAPQKLALKRMLRHMAEEGLLERRTRKFLDPSRLPPVAPLLVTGIDEDGELVAQPLEWDEEAQGPPPRILVEARRAAGTGEDKQPPRAGDRILARLTETGDAAYPYSARVLRRLEAGTRVLGVLRAGPGDTLRVIPTDKKARNEYELSQSDAGGGVPGELVAVELAGDPRRGVARAKVTERFGSVTDQRNIALIAIHQHGIPDQFPREVIDEAERASPAPDQGPGRPAQGAADHHRSARRPRP